jgi:hypothetical protein
LGRKSNQRGAEEGKGEKKHAWRIWHREKGKLRVYLGIGLSKGNVDNAKKGS